MSVVSQESVRTTRAGSGSRLLSNLPAFTAFAQDVEDSLDGEQLRYSERERLLRRAQHFGLKRFDANLIIALVQSRVQPIRVRQEPDARYPGWTTTLATVLAVQSVIVAAAWIVFR